MELYGARVAVAGATGVLGAEIVRALDDAGAEVGLLGRDRGRLTALAEELEAPMARIDAADATGCARAVDALAAALDGLDAIVVAIGAAGFGAAGELERGVVQSLFEVNALAPIALIESALGHLPAEGAVVALTAIVAEQPMARMAAYSASKAALSAYLTALRRERRRDGLLVLDVRPGHLDTGFERRALAGEPMPLPEPLSHGQVVEAVVEGLREGRREIVWDLQRRALVAR